jgi:hypothetical protein
MGSMSGDQIYDAFYTHAVGTEGWQTAQTGLRKMANAYPDRAAGTQRVIDTLQQGWQGQASDLASQGLAPIAVAQYSHGEHLATAQDAVSQQSESWYRAKNSIQQVPPAPSGWDWFGGVAATVLTGGVAAVPAGMSLVNQSSNHDAASQANVDAYSSYAGTTNDNVSRMPAFDTNVRSGAAPITVGVPSAPQQTATGTAAPQVRGGTSTGSSHPGTSGLVAPNSGPPAMPNIGATSGATRTAPMVPPIPGGTTTAGATIGAPLVIGSPGGGMPTGGGSAPGGGVVGEPTYVPGSIGNILGGGDPGLPASATGSGGGRSGRLGGGGGADGFGRGNGDVAGGRAGASTGAGVPPEGDGVPGGNARSGAGAVGNAATAEEQAMAGERAAAKGSGMGMTGAPGGAGGRKEEDAEHKRKYDYGLQPEDFESDDPTVPPVIGEQDPNRR